MICPYCNSRVYLQSSKKLYNRDFGFVWICAQYPKCDAYVGCHKGTKIPLGSPANAELRSWRRLAHSSFDVLWRRKKQRLLREDRKLRLKRNSVKYDARSSGYKWLSETLNIEFDKCHIGMFDIDKCKQVISICKPYLNDEHINQINREITKHKELCK